MWAMMSSSSGCSSGQVIDAALHYVERDWLGEIVVFVAVFAGQIAATNRNDMSQDGVVRRGQPFGDHL
jgi:hypothetical protein